MSDYFMEQDLEDERDLYSRAPVAGQIDEEGHMQAEELWGVQTRIFDISINASMTELSKTSNKAIWSVGSNMHSDLQNVIASRNRDKATHADREGDLRRCIILNAQVVEQRNDAPVKVGIRINHLMNRLITDKGAYNWTIRAHTPTSGVSKVQGHIFEPTNIFTKTMYKDLDRMDLHSLDREIKIDEKDKEASISTQGIAWHILGKNVDNGMFEDWENEFYRMEASLQQTQARRTFIPYEIAKELKEAMAEPVMQIEKSFVDLSNLQATFFRADGDPWNSVTGLVGESAYLGEDSQDQERSHNLTKINEIGIKLRMDYILYPEN